MTKRPYDMQRRTTLEAETRERIVRATVDLHAKHGPLGTSYAMIAKRAQVAPQTVYNHFPALDALFGACTGHVGRRAPPLGPDTFRSGRTPAKRLRAAGRGGIRAARLSRALDAPRLVRGGAHPRAGRHSGQKQGRASSTHCGGHRSGARADRPPLSTRPSCFWITRPGRNCRKAVRMPRRLASPAIAWPICCPGSPNPNLEGNSHEPEWSLLFHPRRRDRRRDIPDQHARPASVVPGGFTFNQYLIRDADPLLFHTGPRMLFGAVREAIGRVIPVETLRYISFSHVEADECGSLNQFLAVAPQAVPLCGQVAAMVSIGDLADRPPRALADLERLSLGQHDGAMDRRAASAAWMGVRLPVRVHDAHPALRRPVHAIRRDTPRGHGERHSRAQRSGAGRNGLLRAFAGHRPVARAPRRHGSHDACVHARPGLARRRRGVAAQSRLAAGVDSRVTLALRARHGR